MASTRGTRFARLGRLLRARRPTFDPLLGAERPDEAFEAAWRSRLKTRIVVVVAFVGCWVAGIEARLVYLQVIQHDALVAKARKHQELKVPLEATRGDIVDRHGELLAYSVEADSIVADPSNIKDPAATVRSVCAALGDCTPKEREQLLSRLSADTQYALIRQSRAVSPAQVQRIAALELKGVMLQTDTRRYYPRFELASHVLGFVGIDNVGQAGVERVYDAIVHGRDGEAYAQVDARRQRLDMRVERAPVAGASLELTLDLYLQYIAERELKAGVEANQAAGGAAIIMDPRTGEILALAAYPTFNPNAVGKSTDNERRNRATQDVYEPGSTFKIVTASAALEEGIFRPTDIIDTNPGSIRVPGRAKAIDDTHLNGAITFEDVIVKSSNVGAVKIGLRTGAERMTKYVHRFGFGEVVARDFAGQSRGIWNGTNLSESALASVSMGYQVSVTPMQMAAAASAVANGGVLMEPHVVRAVVQNGRRQEMVPTALRRAIRADTAATMTAIMEGVVSERGTAHAASLARYQVAGKTGTAHKVVDGRYADKDYNASFVGFVPSRNPVFTILVVIDTPRAHGYYGGVVAAPIFKRIAEAALQQAGVAPSTNPVPPIYVAGAAPDLPARPTRATAIIPARAAIGGPALMPDLVGLGAREAMRALGDAGLKPQLTGAGVVVRQTPEPGTPVDPGDVGIVELRRTGGDPAAARGAP